MERVNVGVVCRMEGHGLGEGSVNAAREKKMHGYMAIWLINVMVNT